MAEGHNQKQVVASIIIRRSYLQKLIFPTAVIQTHRHLLPQTLFENRRAAAILKSDRNHRFHVTFSLGRNHERLVLLETGWRDVVHDLGLVEHDEVAISLEDEASSTYTIGVVNRVLAPVEGPQAEEADIYQGGDEINLDQEGDTHATAAAASTSAPSSSRPQGEANSAILKIDLNKLPEESDEEEIN
ncbi:hypothetical protein SLEP1_g20744 [Rubroshorea leprosula]|uniref:TF-B3 domain-containing protein n=1 Tax=Rubroshorea leprosula TaxID=152421 RepID=A0AAV5J3N5_9ROSI|nr:hypothetical protein SLEP1_g20744 [Rubroshorea leprosula]